MKTCGEWLPELLESYGIDTVFGIPGVHTVELYRGLPNTGLRHITPRHEQGAGFMADGYARTHGRPAACFIITGPGMTNIATAMGQAYADSVPMLVISSVNNTRELGMGEGRLHELRSQREMIQGTAVFSHTVLNPANLPSILSRTFNVFASERPGPVHIEIPLDVITQTTNLATPQIVPVAACSSPNAVAIEQAATLLRQAEKPLVVLGGGTQNASAQARRLVDQLGAPTVLTINAKGVLPAGHPLSLGSRMPCPEVLDLMRDADVLLAIGTELSETDTLLFNGQLTLTGKVIRVDIESAQLSKNALATVPICADAGLAMQALSQALGNMVAFSESTVEQITSVRQAADKSLGNAMQPYRKLMNYIDEALPNAIIVGDSTQPVYAANLFYEPQKPRHYFNSSTGYGTLGYALPAALGAKLASPECAVVSIIGDGGLQFTIGELSTAVELGLGLPILVWDNTGYGEIKRYMTEADIPPIGVDIYTPDFLTIAKGFGCFSTQPDDWEGFMASLHAAHIANGPTLILLKESDVFRW